MESPPDFIILDSDSDDDRLAKRHCPSGCQHCLVVGPRQGERCGRAVEPGMLQCLAHEGRPFCPHYNVRQETFDSNLDVLCGAVVAYLSVEDISMLSQACAGLWDRIRNASEYVFQICQHKSPHGVLLIDSDDGARLTKIYRNGSLHCKNGPAWTVEKWGILSVERWYLKGLTHRSGDDPAVIERDEADGSVQKEVWCCNGQIHRNGTNEAMIDHVSPRRKQFYKFGAKLGRKLDLPVYLELEEIKRQAGEIELYCLQRSEIDGPSIV